MTKLLDINSLPKEVVGRLINDPAFFSLIAFDVWLWSKQREISKALLENRRVAVYSATGTGKSFLEALLTIWFLQTRRNAIVILVSPNYRQLLRSVWYQVQELYRNARIKLLGEPTNTRWRVIETNSLAEPVSYRKIEALQGIHKENMLFIVDEASGVDEEVFNAIEGNMTGGDSYFLVMGNPLRPEGEFYNTLFNPAFYKVKISLFDTPNFSGEIETIPEPYRSKLAKLLPNEEYLKSVRLKYGENSPYWKAKILGEFPSGNETGLFSITDIEECMKLPEFEKQDPVLFTIDVAREGINSTVIAIWKGFNLVDLVEIKKNNFNELANWITNLHNDYKPDKVILDTTGIGVGLYDILSEKGMEVEGVQFSESAVEDDKYANIRTEMYFRLSDAIRQKRVKLLDNNDLKSDLLMQEYEFDSQGRFKLVDKHKLQKKYNRSPDFADAVALRFVNPKKSQIIFL